MYKKRPCSATRSLSVHRILHPRAECAIHMQRIRHPRAGTAAILENNRIFLTFFRISSV
jgi:hypothetical protein